MRLHVERRNDSMYLCFFGVHTGERAKKHLCCTHPSHHAIAHPSLFPRALTHACRHQWMSDAKHEEVISPRQAHPQSEKHRRQSDIHAERTRQTQIQVQNSFAATAHRRGRHRTYGSNDPPLVKNTYHSFVEYPTAARNSLHNNCEVARNLYSVAQTHCRAKKI